ncbi:type ii secretory atpase tfp pilus assembly atpase [Leptolyngbya sp. Heron Island J]|uniref:ATPase, T2SS/T4P/T4SS family n=1 Tax=Leptolyngbya sp. Heron Island J TaxID=1385935 RepID=UPI0003B93D27|nr:type ii secretory ATPase tfp pilus assembly ATPase [Leptolyngbya sp. Heron Island J]ESA38256.1 type ii secretory atpase tfp pilus assembly atpase [Leptolyngbya sp. Heron Island J]
MSTFSENKALSPLSISPKQTETMANLEQMFLLIEGILPFEACLYYQVLPLSIEGSSLNLGMVNPDDTKAADYVRRQVSYINCSIVSRSISSDWHREILSKFLSHSAKSRQASQVSQPKAKSPRSPFEEQPTLVVGSPTEIIENPRDVIMAEPTTKPQPPSPSSVTTQKTEADATPQTLPPPEEHTTNEEETQPPLNIQLEEVPTKSDTSSPTPEEQPSETISEPPLSHNNLNPKEFTQTLLKRVITQEGIGRLYLERQSTICRILWSKDGVLQSVVEDISAQLFQGVINELKRMMSLSLIPVRKPKQIEIERIHNQKRILLRFRVMPGDHGEEATLQVLRGAALRFYQQQQMDNLGRDALGIAHDLQQRIDELRSQAQRNLELQDDTKQKTLPAIISMLKQMEHQLNAIIQEPGQ